MIAMRRALALTLTALALLAAGCTSPETVPPGGPPDTPPGDGGTTPTNVTPPANGTPPDEPPTGGDADVLVLDNIYQPNQTTVAAGGSLSFRNDGQALHSVTIQKSSGEPVVDSDVDPGEAVTVDFAEAGTYQLRCKYHSADFNTGQVGVITVT